MSWMPEDLNREARAADQAAAPAAPPSAATPAPAAAPAPVPDPTSREALKAGSAKVETDSFVRAAVSFMRQAGQLPSTWGDAQIEGYADAELARDQAAGQIIANFEKDKGAYEALLRRWAHEQGAIVRNVQAGLPPGFQMAPPGEAARLAGLSERAFQKEMQAEIAKAEAAANKERQARGQPVRWST